MSRSNSTKKFVCPHLIPKYNGPSYKKVFNLRKKYMHPMLTTNYIDPLMLVHGHKQYVFDEKGTQYLDLFGGVTTVSVGHSHPRITEVVAEQSKMINHTTMLYMNNKVAEYCEAFAQKLPKEHDWIIHMVNSGSEANDFAMLQARVYTKNYVYMSMRNGYHGFTEGSRGLNSVPGWKHQVPPPSGTLKTINPSTYRGLLGTSPKDLNKYVNDFEELVVSETGGQLAGFVCDYIQGVGGVNTLIPGYLPKIYDIVRKYGGICISDEVQCGFGRLGSHYWGFEAGGVVPDIITTAKSVANGWPVGIVATKREIAESMEGTLYFNTFGGNAICSAVAHETMKIIDDEGLQQNSKKIGKIIKKGLIEIQKNNPIIGDVRGQGLLLGFELVKNQKTKEPAKEITVKLMQELKDKYQILVGKGGPYGNVIRIHPPMCINKQDAEYFLSVVEDSVKSIRKN